MARIENLVERSALMEEHDRRRSALATLLAELGLAAATITDPRDLEYFSGYTGTTSLGPNPFAGPVGAALVVAASGHGILVVPQPDNALIELNAGAVELRPFETFTELTSLRPRDRLARALHAALAALEVDPKGAVGFEGSSVPAVVLARLDGLRAGSLVDIDVEIARLRMRKSRYELELLRRSIAVCDAAQLAVTERAGPGATQAELTDAVRAVVEREAGRPTPIVLEVAYGRGYGAEASERALQSGDLLLSDIAPRVDGYWGDSCDTRFVGAPSAVQRAIVRTVRDALHAGTDAVRPGTTAHDVDAVMRERVARKFPAYGGSGHGIGLDYHEPPRLIPGECITLEEDMVLALEPGIYLDDEGAVRLEHLVRVVPQGCEVLSTHLTEVSLDHS